CRSGASCANCFCTACCTASATTTRPTTARWTAWSDGCVGGTSPMPDASMGPWLAAAVLLAAAVPLTALMTALLERSGPIRMRHWVEEAGGQLRALYEKPVRFELFRYLVNLIAKLVPLALLGCLAKTIQAFGGLEAGSSLPWWIAGVV